MTNKDYLSQDEIDALLKNVSDSGQDYTVNITADDYLTPTEQDALLETANIMLGSFATALSTLLRHKVEIDSPILAVVKKQDAAKSFPEPVVTTFVDVVAGFQGTHFMVIPNKAAQFIAEYMQGKSDPMNDEMINNAQVGVIRDTINHAINFSATALSNVFNRVVNISTSGIELMDFNQNIGEQIFTEDLAIQIRYRLRIGELSNSYIAQLLPIWFAKEMLSMLMETMNPLEQSTKSHSSLPTIDNIPAPAQPSHLQESMPYQQPHSNVEGGYSTTMQQRSRNVQTAQFTDLSQYAQASEENPNLNLLLDIPLKVTVELGRTQKQVKDILDMSPGTIIELDKLAGEPVDILVNNKLIAKGEVVVIDENFGVRVTDIVSTWDRIQKLK
jgi:flagellar motor switch protein FliN/FliY